MHLFKYTCVLFLFSVITTNGYSQNKSDDIRDSVNHYIFSRDSLGGESYYLMIMGMVYFCSHAEIASKRYSILFSNGNYINVGILSEKDGDLYTKYDPDKKDNEETMSAVIVTKSRKEIYYWVAQELKKGSVVSIGNAHKEGVYIGKSFSDN